jgi:hypothetical protein
MQTVWYHLKFYQSFLVGSWDNMTPMQYGAVLITIGIAGWLLMKHGAAQ